MNNPDINYKVVKRKHLFFIIMTAIIAFGLSCFVISPGYVYLSSNVVYRYTPLPNLLDLLRNILDITAYALCFSTIIYSVYRLTLKKSFGLIATYCIAVLTKYTINILIQMITDGGVIAALDIVIVAFNYLFELLTLLIVVCITVSIIKKKKTDSDTVRFEKLYSSKDPLQHSALFIGIILCTIKIITRILFDIGYGAPQSLIEVLWMAAYYFCDILICPIVYFVSLVVIIHHEKNYQNLIN